MAPNVRPVPISAASELEGRVVDLNDTADLFADCRDIHTVLVTGGAGFIGSHTSEALLKMGRRVVVVDEMNDYYDPRIKQANVALLQKTAAEFSASEFKFYCVDICNREKMRQIITEEKVDAIVHLAARAGVRASIDQPELYVHANVLGTTVLLELYQQYRQQIKHFLYASSSSVYGSRPQIPFSDLAVLDTAHIQSPYAATKLACETMAWAYSNMFQLRMTGLRFFTVYGPRGRVDMAPFKFVDRISRGQPIDVYGDGTSMRDYTYIDDIVRGILGALFMPFKKSPAPLSPVHDGTPLHRVYNLGNGSPVTLREFISTVEECVGRQAIVNPMPDQTGDVDRTFADISQAQREIGYQPKTDLRTGLTQFVHWYHQYRSDQ